MTINQLIKRLEKIQNKYGKRVHVSLNLSELRLKCEDYSHWSLDEVCVDTVKWEKDDDSGILADGSERIRTVVVLS